MPSEILIGKAEDSIREVLNTTTNDVRLKIAILDALKTELIIELAIDTGEELTQKRVTLCGSDGGK